MRLSESSVLDRARALSVSRRWTRSRQETQVLQVLGRLDVSASPSAASRVERRARHCAFFCMDFSISGMLRAAPAVCIWCAFAGDCCREHLPHLPVPSWLAAWRPRRFSAAHLLSRRICTSAPPTLLLPCLLPAVARCGPLLAASRCCTPLQLSLHGSQAGPFTATRACLEAHGSRRQPSSACQALLCSRRATGGIAVWVTETTLAQPRNWRATCHLPDRPAGRPASPV